MHIIPTNAHDYLQTHRKLKIQREHLPWTWCALLSSLLHIVRNWSCYLAHTMKFFMNKWEQVLQSVAISYLQSRRKQRETLTAASFFSSSFWQAVTNGRSLLLGQAEWGKHPSSHNTLQERKKEIPLKITPWTWCSHCSFIGFIGCWWLTISDQYCTKCMGKTLIKSNLTLCISLMVYIRTVLNTAVKINFSYTSAVH